ncbi:MAG TPA: cell division protein FtsA [Candidatus Paceibacterota bacterium]
MRGQIIASIDVGSSNVRVAVCEYSRKDGTFSVRALAKVPSDGLKNGYIVNPDAVTASIGNALREAERTVGERIKRAIVSVGGVGLGTVIDVGTVAISRADSLVSDFDIDRLLQEAEARIGERPNTRILHAIPSEYKVDGRKILGKPGGYSGNKLEQKTTFITAAAPHLDALVKSVEDSGVEVQEVYAAPIAESMVTTTATARNAGTLVANIGAQTVSMLTIEDGLPTSLKVFPLGSTDITHDIALGLRIPLEAAESIKINGEQEKKNLKRVSEITEARLSDIFELIDTHLKKIGRSGLLPAGVVFTGEGAHTKGLENLGRRQLGLPVKIARNSIPDELTAVGTDEGASGKNIARMRERLEKARGPEWSTALGLCVLGMSAAPEESLGIRMARKTKNSLMGFLKQFLP